MVMLESAAERITSLAEPASTPVIRAAPYSVAVALPARRLTTAELAERFGLSEEWIVSRTGVRERPVAEPHERLSDFAARAGAAALERAGVDPAEVDLVLAATMTADEVTPYTAPLVAHAIGAVHAGGFDVGAACTAFLSAVSIAAAQIETGRARWVLVIGADFITRLVIGRTGRPRRCSPTRPARRFSDPRLRVTATSDPSSSAPTAHRRRGRSPSSIMTASCRWMGRRSTATR